MNDILDWCILRIVKYWKILNCENSFKLKFKKWLLAPHDIHSVKIFFFIFGYFVQYRFFYMFLVSSLLEIGSLADNCTFVLLQECINILIMEDGELCNVYLSFNWFINSWFKTVSKQGFFGGGEGECHVSLHTNDVSY